VIEQVIALVTGLVAAVVVLSTYLLMKSKVEEARREGYEKGFSEGVESQRRWNAHKAEKKLIKVNIANFGVPSLKIYSPIDYMGPLTCTSCNKTLIAGDDFYEIPIVSDPGNYAAVHLRCERKEMYGKPPNDQADERQPREVPGGGIRRGPFGWLRKSVQGSDGRAQ